VPLTAAYLALVAWATLGPQPLDPDEAGFLHRLIAHERTVLAPRFPAFAHWLSYHHVEYVANIAMFLPVGVLFLLLVARRRRRWWVALLMGVALSGAIEVAQRFIPGRVSDLRDVAANSIGTAIGVVAALLVSLPAYRRERARLRDRELAAEFISYRRA
jgi:cyanate permease